MSLSRRRTAGALAAAALTGTLLLAAPGAATAVTPASSSLTSLCATHTCITDVRVAAHDGYDRVVFDLTSGTGLSTWNDQITTDDSYPHGEEPGIAHFAIKGSAYLRLHFYRATTWDSGLGKSVYTTANPLSTGLSSAKGVQLYDDNEGEASFAITLGNESSYNIFTLTGPDRIVVDVYN